MSRTLIAIYLVLFNLIPAWGDDKQPLVGVWKLLTYEVEFQDSGDRQAPFGSHPHGYAIFTSEGRTMAVLSAEGRENPKTDSDRAAAFMTTVAYTGIYRLEGNHWITKVDTSWNESWVGTEQIRFYELDGDTLTVTSNWRPYPLFEGRIARGLLRWVREDK